MERYEGWPTLAEQWMSTDHALATDRDGWRPVVDRTDLKMWSRAMPDDDNLLFRWHLPIVEAPADIVFEGFVHRLLEYHQVWTKEFAGGRVVESPRHDARILHQRFEPGIPGISPRDVCSIEVVRDVAPGVKLASFRSIDRLPVEPRHVRLDWWGAALCVTRDDGVSSELTYLDRENQGGAFPVFLMNRMMPRYLVYQAEHVAAFFRGGGPPELRIPREEGSPWKPGAL